MTKSKIMGIIGAAGVLSIFFVFGQDSASTPNRTSQLNGGLSASGQDVIATYGDTPDEDLEADAPWMVTSVEQDIPIYFYAHEADAREIIAMRIINNSTGETLAPYIGNPIVLNETPFIHVFEGLNAASFGISEPPAKIDITVEVDLRSYDLPAEPLDYTYRKRLWIYVGEPLPSLQFWHAGDTHFHSGFTDNPLEWGSGLLPAAGYSGQDILKRMGLSMGLKWVTVTDHSCDFGDDDFWTTDLEDSAAQWEQMSGLCQFWSDTNFTLIPAEEVTATNEDALLPFRDRAHVLAYGAGEYIDGPEVGPDGISDGIADRTGSLIGVVPTLISIENASPDYSFSFGAHPMAESPIITLNWSPFSIENALYPNSFKGFELFNTKQTKKKKSLLLDLNPYDLDPFPWEKRDPDDPWDRELLNGISLWDDLLLENLSPLRKVFIEGGSDAHGDFNYASTGWWGVGGMIDDRLLDVHDNAFAKVRTYIYAETEGTPDEEAVLDALRNGHSVVTDGPLVIFGIDGDADGDLVSGEPDVIPGDAERYPLGTPVDLMIKWSVTEHVPSADYGAYDDGLLDIQDGSLDEITIVYGSSSGKADPVVLPGPFAGNSTNWTVPPPAVPGTYFYRVEAVIKDDTQVIYRAYTNPIWITWENNLPVLLNGHVSPEWGVWFNEFYFYVNYFDPDGHVPTVRQVVVDNVAHNMSLYSGTAANGIYRYYGSWMSLGPHEHYFHFEDGFGGSVTTPVSPTPSVYVQLHFQTDPYYLDITFDGQVHATPYNAYAFPGTAHAIGTYSPQSVGATSRLVWSRWSDGLGETHDITAPNGAASYIAYFAGQRLLTTSANPITGGSVSPAGLTWQYYYDTVPVTAIPAPGYAFSYWSGTQTGTSNPINIYINNAYTEVANFVVVSEAVSIPSCPAGETDLKINLPSAFLTEGSHCSYGHQVQYLFDWGDGTESGWLPVGTTIATHVWIALGDHDVRAKARCATNIAIESGWSVALRVSIMAAALKVDLNGDGQEDILWRCQGSGDYQGLNLVWFLDQSGLGEARPVSLAAAPAKVGEPSLALGLPAGTTVKALGAVGMRPGSLRMPQGSFRTALKGGKPASLKPGLIIKDPLNGGADPSTLSRLWPGIDRDRFRAPDITRILTRKDAADPTVLKSGTAKIASLRLATELVFSQVPDTAWEIAGTGDFNGDTKTDILWRYYGQGPYQGLNDIWLMDGTTFVSENVFSQIVDTNWRIAGTGDFNGDTKTDILWRYYGTGAYQGLNVVWYMNGSTFVGESVFSQVLDTDWRIEGTGDFNGDGKTDILWRYYGTGPYQGLNDVWFMNGSTFISESVFSQILDTAWQIGGTGDFNGDGQMDILWRYYGTGAYQGLNDIWYMNGTTFVSEEVFSQVPDVNWRIVNR